MQTPTPAIWTPGEVTDLVVDFGLPVVIILVAMTLLLTGVDGEVKTILVLAAGWIFKSGITRKQRAK